jgi:hypothetical protein
MTSARFMQANGFWSRYLSASSYGVARAALRPSDGSLPVSLELPHSRRALSLADIEIA